MRRPAVLGVPGTSLPSAEASPTPHCTAIAASTSSRHVDARSGLPAAQSMASSVTPSTSVRPRGSS